MISAVLAAVAFLTSGAHGQSPIQPSDETRTYTGRVLNVAGGKPLAGATVVLMPCIAATGTRTEHSIRITAGDGTYKFEHNPWPCGFVIAVRKGFSSGRSKDSQRTIAPTMLLEDLKLWPVASPLQMEASAISSAYGASYGWVHFRDASFSPDGETLNFSSDDGGRSGGVQGWSYNLKSRALQTGSVQPFQNDLDVVGGYRIDSFRCRGCPETLTANPVQNPTHAKPIVITSSLSFGSIASSDDSAMLWGERNRQDQPVLGLYVFAAHQRRFVVLPNAGEPLAARPEGDGYLVAYATFGLCAPEADELTRLVEDRRYQEGPRPWSVCFIHVPSPTH